tara:strand:- start:137342 stop:138199 length:858 start_codon:yes stop_codon:yes gene_type:complete
LLVVLVVCITLVFLDLRTSWVGWIRYGAGYVTDAVHYVAHLPSTMGTWVGAQARTTEDLRDDNQRLDRQLLILQQKAQRLAVLEAENVRLRELLNSSARLDARVFVAEIIGVEPDPNRQELMINKGSGDSVFNGQAVLDASGLIGQITQVGPLASRVLLVTDATHALSVQVNRSGTRSILVGTGHPDRLRLLYVPDTADITEGDLLVTTGLGKRYPAGYPVAIVVAVKQEPGKAFLSVDARPTAHIDRSSHVLLVAPTAARRSAEARASASDEPTAATNEEGGIQ